MGFLNILKNLLLVVIALLAIAAGFAAVASNAALGVALNENFYLKTLDELKAYDALSSGISDMFSKQAGGAGAGLSITIPPEWARQQAQSVLPAFFKYLRGESETIAAEISLKELKLQLVDLAIAQIKKQLQGAPIQIKDCTPTEKFVVSNIAGTSMPSCLPTTQEQKSAALELLGGSQLSEQVPDKISVQELLNKSGSGQENPLAQARDAVMLAKTVFVVLTIAFVVLLGLIFIFSRSFNWTGGTMLLTGIASLLPALAIGFVLQSMLHQGVSGGMPDFAQELFLGFAQKFAEALQYSLFLYAGALIAIGIILIAAGFWLKRRQPKEQKQLKEQKQPKEPKTGK